MRHSIDTYIYTQQAISLKKEFGPWMEKSQTVYTLDEKQSEQICVGNMMKVICKVCVSVDHVDQCMECKRKESFLSRN